MAKLHSTLIILLFAPAAWAGIWPDQFGSAQRISAKPATLSDQKLWSEYGFQEGEQAQYEAGPEKFTATAYRLHDSTAALGAFEWQRQKNAIQIPESARVFRRHRKCQVG